MRFHPFLRPNLAPALDEQIAAEAQRRANADVRQRFKPGERVRAPEQFRPSGNLADDIIKAYRRATGEPDPDDDDSDKPEDDNSELRGPPQRPMIIATPDAIIRAARKAGFL